MDTDQAVSGKPLRRRTHITRHKRIRRKPRAGKTAPRLRSG